MEPSEVTTSTATSINTTTKSLFPKTKLKKIKKIAFKAIFYQQKYSPLLSHSSAATCVFSSTSLGTKPGLTDFMVMQII